MMTILMKMMTKWWWIWWWWWWWWWWCIELLLCPGERRPSWEKFVVVGPQKVWTSKNPSCPISKTGINIVQTDNFAVLTWNPTKWLHITSELSVSTKTSHLRFLIRRAHTRITFFSFILYYADYYEALKTSPPEIWMFCAKNGKYVGKRGTAFNCSPICPRIPSCYYPSSRL